MNPPEDTIAAIATPPGEGGIAIIRISGAETYAIADRIFQTGGPRPSDRRPFTFAYGRIVDTQGAGLDDVLMLFMRAPRSLTGEDVVEVHTHGGAICARRVLRRVLNEGARPAEPGEFTKRAFLNGRMDLMQAEAVLDLIRARSERAASAAHEQLEGVLSARFNGVYDEIVSVAADLEATLDFPDDELPDAVIADVLRRLAAVRHHVIKLLATWDEGHDLRDGVLVAIIGRPNAGKSTLMNALLGTDRAIVSTTAGTTRDTIEEVLVLDGIPFRLVDTAGLRESDCDIEQEGIRRTYNYLKQSDIQIFILDASGDIDGEDGAHIAQLDPATSLIVLNKADLGLRCRAHDMSNHLAVETCLIGGDDRAGPVRSALTGMLHGRLDLSARPHAVVSERHRALLDAALHELDTAIQLTRGELSDQVVFAASSLRSALELLGAATGRVYEDELLDRIFSRFCIGK